MSSSDAPQAAPSGNLTPEERQGLRQRTELAKRTAEEMLRRAFVLLGRSAHQRASAAQRTEESDRVRDDLRDSVRSYGAALRSLGVQPEAAVILVKDAIQLASPEARRRDGEKLREQIVTWAIDGYYANDAA